MRFLACVRAAIAVAGALVFGWAPGCANDLTDSIEGRPCTSAGACLAGYRCVEGICRKEIASDAGHDGAAREGGPSVPAAGGGGAIDAASDREAGAGGASDSGSDVSAPGPDAAGDARGDGMVVDATVTDGAAEPLVACRGLRCASDELCCLSKYPGYPDAPDPADFSCSASAEACEYSLACDSDRDCPEGELCCGVLASGDWHFACSSSCGAASVRVECSVPSDCPDGEQCCGTWSNTLQRFRTMLCGTSCDYVFCESDEDCEAGQTCAFSEAAPTFKFCE